MSKVIFELGNGIDGEIELCDNLFMDFWKMVFERNNKKHGVNVRYSKCYNSNMKMPDKTQINLVSKQKYVDIINESIDKIVSAGFTWSRGKMNIDSGYEDCNKIHRGFTTLMSTGCIDKLDLTHEEVKFIKENKFDLNNNSAFPYFMPNPEQYEKFNYNKYAKIKIPLHDINANVHHIEDKFLINHNNIKLSKELINHYGCKNFKLISLDWNSKGKDGITDAHKIDFNFNDLRYYANYSNDPYYNVFDLKNILGKDYQTCWENHDDPHNIDICNLMTTKGGFEIKPEIDCLFNKLLIPWLKDINHSTQNEVIRPITIGHIDDKWVKEHQMLNRNRNIDDEVVKVDLID